VGATLGFSCNCIFRFFLGRAAKSLSRAAKAISKVVGASLITPARQNDGRHNGRDVDDLDECEQGVISKYAVAWKQCAGNQPD